MPRRGIVKSKDLPNLEVVIADSLVYDTNANGVIEVLEMTLLFTLTHVVADYRFNLETPFFFTARA